MTRYLVETFVGGADADALVQATERARAAARELTAEGTPVRCVRTLYVPADEICFWLYEAPSAAAIGEAARRAAIEFDRVVEAVPIG